jgi:hypothetical protein
MKLARFTTTFALIAGLVVPALALAEPTALESGSFVSAEHDTAGTVTIYKLNNSDRTLRLTNFHTSNGPDVHVYLTSAEKVNSNGDVIAGKYLDLGTLKGNIGNQNYSIPETVDLNDFHSVSIWCARFRVNFGAAQLGSGSAMNSDHMNSGQMNSANHMSHGG